MGKPERHLWFQEHWNILSNVLFRQAAAQKKMPMLWKSLNCWSCKSEKSKRAKKLMPLVYPSQTFLQTWKVVSYWQQQYHPGYIPKQWKPSYVSNRDSYNNSQEQVGKFFFESISQFFGRCINYTEKWWVVEVPPLTSCVNVIICIDSFWSLCAESVNGGTDVVIKGQWTMTTGILIGGISGGWDPSEQIKADIGIRETWSSSGKDKMKLSFFFSHQKMYNDGFFNKNWLFL